MGLWGISGQPTGKCTRGWWDLSPVKTEGWGIWERRTGKACSIGLITILEEWKFKEEAKAIHHRPSVLLNNAVKSLKSWLLNYKKLKHSPKKSCCWGISNIVWKVQKLHSVCSPIVMTASYILPKQHNLLFFMQTVFADALWDRWCIMGQVVMALCRRAHNTRIVILQRFCSHTMAIAAKIMYGSHNHHCNNYCEQMTSADALWDNWCIMGQVFGQRWPVLGGLYSRTTIQWSSPPWRSCIVIIIIIVIIIVSRRLSLMHCGAGCLGSGPADWFGCWWTRVTAAWLLQQWNNMNTDGE